MKGVWMPLEVVPEVSPPLLIIAAAALQKLTHVGAQLRDTLMFDARKFTLSTLKYARY